MKARSAGPVSWWRLSGPAELLLARSEIQSSHEWNTFETALCFLPQTSQHLERNNKPFSPGHNKQAVEKGVENCQCSLQHPQLCAEQSKTLSVSCSWEHQEKALKPRVAFSVGCLWDSATRITLGDVLDAAWMGNVAKKYLEEIPSHSAYLFLLFTAPHLSVFSTFCLQCRFTQKTRQHSWRYPGWDLKECKGWLEISGTAS